MIHALVKVPGWSQAFSWTLTWDVVHLLAENLWGNKLDIQRCDNNLSWVTLAFGSTSLLMRWNHPCQLSCSLFNLHFVALKSTGSALLRSSILIWHAVSVFLFALWGPWFSFPVFCFGSGRWLHSSRLFPILCLLTWWRRCRIIVCCTHDNV